MLRDGPHTAAAGLSLVALVGVLVVHEDADTRRDRRGRRADDVAPVRVRVVGLLLPDRARARRRQHGGARQQPTAAG